MTPPTRTLDGLVARCTFPAPGTHVDCAVSGGTDSLALMALARHARCTVRAIHVDHGLRPGSADEATLVAQAATRLGASFESRTVQVAPGPNVEARARTARYAALPPGALTGHTADDQAETILLHLLRGSVVGLAGMRPDDDQRGDDRFAVRRPLLALRRADTAWVCATLDLQPLHDPTNDDVSLRRNAVRHRLLPLAAQIAQRDLVPVLTRQADLLRDEFDLLDDLAAAIDATDARALAAAPVALARRAIRRWLGGEHPPDAATVARVLAVARGEARACETVDGRRVTRHRQKLSVSPGPPDEVGR